MTGLEKMKNQILEEAKTSADEKIKDANAKAEEILAAAREEAEKTAERISKKSEADIANYKDRVKSSCDLKKRTAVLEAKQEMISEVLDRAFEMLKSMDEAEYFGMLKKMLEKYVLPQEGEIYFSSADLEKTPESFKRDIDAVAKAKGGKLTLSKEGKRIEGGFVLAYGGIEENCTFKAIFDAERDRLSDKVHEVLFV